MVISPEIGGQKAEYNSNVAEKYDANITTETEKKRQEQQKLDETTLLADVYYEQLYNDPKVMQSSYSFLTSETYTDTDIADKTDTYVNMNTSYRYIKYNVNKAGDWYNKLYPDCDRTKDSPKKVFDTIIKKLKFLGYDKIHKNGKWEQNPFATDLDFMYAIGLFQAIEEKSNAGATNLSKKDFRVGPKTLIALLQIGTPLKTTTVVENPIVAAGTEKTLTGTVINETEKQLGILEQSTEKSTEKSTEQSTEKSSEQLAIDEAIVGSELSDGQDKIGGVNTFNKIYTSIEKVLQHYIEEKTTPKERTIMKQTFKDKIEEFANSKNPYYAAYTRLIDDMETQWRDNKIEGYDKVLTAKIGYLLNLMSEMKKHDKKIIYDPAFTLRSQMTEDDRNKVVVGIGWNDLVDVISLIKKDKKFAANVNKDKIPLASFGDVLNVYNAALDNYRKENAQDNNN